MKLFKFPEKDGLFVLPFGVGEDGPSSVLIYFTVFNNDFPSSTKEKFPELC